MATTEFQRGILRLLAPSRKERESYVAGGVALNTLLRAPRRSQDIDLFHDTREAVAASVTADRRQLADAGYEVVMLREAPTFAEAEVRHGAESTLIQWAQDSAYRFFPLCENEELGLTLHPFDLATNKALAMAGRLEARDWVDLLTSIDRIQPLGYLAWAACGKDPGFNPLSLLQEMRRSGRYPQAVLDRLDLGGERLDARLLGERWRQELSAAESICDALPVDAVGACVVSAEGELFRGDLEALREAVRSGRLRYHQGTIGGAWPSFPNA
jgi:hypothetical protein